MPSPTSTKATAEAAHIAPKVSPRPLPSTRYRPSTTGSDVDADADADAVAPTPTPSAKLAAGGLLQALCAQCRPATTRCVARLTPSAQPSHLSRHWLGYCGGASG